MNKIRVLLGILSLTIVGNVSAKEKSYYAPHEGTLPIVYHPFYDISFPILSSLHPFDGAKYSKVFNSLSKKQGFTLKDVYIPQMVSEQDLQKVHSKAYLDSLQSSQVIARIAEIGLMRFIPQSILDHFMLRPMRLATGGTVLAADLALKYGWSVNLSGGYHHAKAHNGEGFCVYADIPLAIYKVWEKNPNLKVMVIDLDAHQGNGHESILKNDPRVSIFDIYNACLYPQDKEAMQYITYNYPITMYRYPYFKRINDADYLNILKQELPRALDEAKPDLIIYNAGTDIYEKDPLGFMGVSKKGIIARDQFVFEQALQRNIPITMVLSGGYTKESAEIIGDSLNNVLRNVIKIKR